MMVLHSAILLAVALALVGCSPPPAARAPEAAITVRGDYRPVALSFAASDAAKGTSGLALCTPDLALVATGGGIRAAGLDAWLFAPGALPVTAVGCDDQDRLYVLLEGRLLMRFPDGVATGRIEALAALPEGKYALLTTGDGTSWMWGEDDAHRWHLFRHRERLDEVWSGKRPVRAVAPAGPSSMVAALGNDVVMLRASGEPVLLTKLGFVDGLAVGADGTLYVSTRDGVLALARSGKKLSAERLTRGIHGPLQARLHTLYVLWREERTVVRLAPTRDVAQR